MKKKVKKHGNSLCVTFDANDKDIYNIKEGDLIDLEVKKVIKSKLSKSAKKEYKLPSTKLKAIILAGGLGSRMGHLAFHKPKCLLEIGGKTVLQRAIDNIRECGIKDVVIIAGHKSDEIRLSGIKYYYDDEFGNKEHKSMLTSLFYSEPEMEDGFIFLYSDIIFKKGVIGKLLQDKHDISIISDLDWMKHYKGRTEHPIGEAENVVIEDGKVVRIGKHLKAEESDGEFIGMIKFSARGAKELIKVFNDIRKKYKVKPFQHAAGLGLKKAYLTDILQEMIDRGYNVYSVNIRGGWHELDTIQDLERVSKFRL